MHSYVHILASRSHLALMMLCHLLPDTRTGVDTSHIIPFIPAEGSL